MQPQPALPTLIGLVSCFYGAHHIYNDLERLPQFIDKKQLKLFASGISNLDDILSKEIRWIDTLLLSRYKLHQLDLNIKRDIATQEEWQHFCQQLSKLQSTIIKTTHMLRSFKTGGSLADVFEASNERTSKKKLTGSNAYNDFKQLNLSLMALEVLAGVTKPLSTPSRLLIDISNRCNYRCRTCFQSNTQDFSYFDLSNTSLKNLLPFLPACSAINLGGTGEPLLSQNTPRLIHIVATYDVKTELVTNGSLLGRIKNFEHEIACLFISMDGATSETVNSIRSGANFDKIIGDIKELSAQLRRQIIFNMVVSRANVHEVLRLAELTKTLGLGGLTLQPFIGYLPWHEQMKLRDEDQPFLSQQISLAREVLKDSSVNLDVVLTVDLNNNIIGKSQNMTAPSYKEILADLDKVQTQKSTDEVGSLQALVEEFFVTTKINYPNILMHLLSEIRDEFSEVDAPCDVHLPLFDVDLRMRELIKVLKSESRLKLPHCLAPYTLSYVLSDGTVKPCCVLANRCGSLNLESAEIIWHSPAYVLLRRNLMSGADLPKQCIGCQDGGRYAMAGNLLAIASSMGVDIGRIETPLDGGLPENVIRMINNERLLSGSEATLQAHSPIGNRFDELNGLKNNLLAEIVKNNEADTHNIAITKNERSENNITPVLETINGISEPGFLKNALVKTVKIHSYLEYKQYVHTMHNEYQKRKIAEEALISGSGVFHVPGYCALCHKDVSFTVGPVSENSTTPNWRESLLCVECGMNNRTRGFTHVFEMVAQPDKSTKIYIAEQLSLLYRYLDNKYPLIVGSEYLGKNRPHFVEQAGQLVQHQDLTNLTFEDNIFDIVLHQDVLEHIPDFEAAIEECYRILKPGGYFFFSAPFILGSEKNTVRARLLPDGVIEHLLPSEYHGNPLDSEGCLAFYHFGWELFEQMNRIGFKEPTALFYWSREYGYLGGEQFFFMARK